MAGALLGQLQAALPAMAAIMGTLQNLVDGEHVHLERLVKMATPGSSTDILKKILHSPIESLKFLEDEDILAALRKQGVDIESFSQLSESLKILNAALNAKPFKRADVEKQIEAVFKGVEAAIAATSVDKDQLSALQAYVDFSKERALQKISSFPDIAVNNDKIGIHKALAAKNFLTGVGLCVLAAGLIIGAAAIAFSMPATFFVDTPVAALGVAGMFAAAVKCLTSANSHFKSAGETRHTKNLANHLAKESLNLLDMAVGARLNPATIALRTGP